MSRLGLDKIDSLIEGFTKLETRIETEGSGFIPDDTLRTYVAQIGNIVHQLDERVFRFRELEKDLGVVYMMRMNAGALAHKYENRKKIVEEILSTEEYYVSQLRECVTDINSVYTTLRDFARKNGSDEDIIESLFDPIEIILEKNLVFLHDLRDKVKSWTDNQMIGEYLIKSAPLFQQYCYYAVSYKTLEGKKVSESLTSKNSPFFSFFEARGDDEPRIPKEKLSSYLIAPIQRILRYPLLLLSLIKDTDDQHPDYENIEHALELFEDIAHEVDNNLTKIENRFAIKALSRDNKLKALLVNPETQVARELVGYIDVKELTIFDEFEQIIDHKDEGRLILFSDIVASTSIYADKGQRYSMQIPIIWLITNFTEEDKETYQIETKDASMTVVMRDPFRSWKIKVPGLSAKQKWVKFFIKTLVPEDTTDAVLIEECLRVGNREAAIRYNFTGLGDYMGGWKDLQPHGRGLFFSDDGTKFDGEWRSEVQAGYGNVTRPDTLGSVKKKKAVSEERFVSGWTFGFPLESVSLPDEQNKLTFTSLTKQDWSLILGTSALLMVQDNTVILNQGESYRCLFVIKSGRVRVQSNSVYNSSSSIVNTLFADDFIGVDALLGIPSQETYTADCDSALYVIDLDVLSVFLTDPHLFRRFGLYLTSEVVNTTAYDDTMNVEVVGAARENGARLIEEKDDPAFKKFSKKSGIEEQLLILRDDFKKKNQPGKMGIFARHICFITETMISSKDIIEIQHITNINRDTKKKKLIISTGEKEFKFGYSEEDECFYMLLTNIWKYSRFAMKKSFGGHLQSHEGKYVVPIESIVATNSSTLFLFDEYQKGLIDATEEIQIHKKGSVILQEDRLSDALYFLDRGICYSHKTNPGKKESAAILHSGSFFGEGSFINMKEKFSISAHSDEVVLKVIHAKSIFALCAGLPEIAGRFFVYLTELLYSRWRLENSDLDASSDDIQADVKRRSTRNNRDTITLVPQRTNRKRAKSGKGRPKKKKL